MMEHIEKLMMTRLHKWVFCHDSVDDEQKDLALQRRIRSVAPPPHRHATANQYKMLPTLD